MEVSVHRTLVDKQCYLQNRSPRSILRRCLRGKFDHIDCWRWSKMIRSSCSFRQKDLVEEETLVVESVEAVKAGVEVPRRAVRARAKARRRTLRPSMRETLGLPLLPPSRPQELQAREG